MATITFNPDRVVRVAVRRWVLFFLPAALLLCLVIFLSLPEPAPEVHVSEKVSDEILPARDPVAFLEKCLKHYDRHIQGYRAVLQKQELIAGRLQKPEEIEVEFREKPFSVYLQWRKGMRRAERVLYVKGENKGQMLARPTFYLRLVAGDVAARDPEGPEGKKSGRYPLTQFGMKKGTERVLATWKEAQASAALHVAYLGVHKLKELNNRPCYKLRRNDPGHPDRDGITDLTMYVDRETLLQTGSVLRDKDGKLIAEYFFRDLKINPSFKDSQFKSSALVP